VSVPLEGVAFALADGMDALRDAGAHVDQLAVIGGGARSTYRFRSWILSVKTENDSKAN